MIRPLFNACKYVASLQWIEDGGRFVIRTLTFGSVAVPDTKPETVKEDLKTSKGFSAKLLVLLNAIVRFIAYMEIGIWFWFLVFFLLVLAYVLVFGPLRAVHEW